MRSTLVLLVILAPLLASATGHAQTTDAAAAQGLFDTGRQLMAQGRPSEACPKFLASLKLDAKTGTALNLAACYDQTGQIASAWARYLETASLAQRAGQGERERYARDRAAALGLRLSRLSITAPTANPGLEVLRDGAPVDAAILGTPVPVDPGKHVIEARAPGKRSWSRTVEITAEPAQIAVEIPSLDDPGVTLGGPAGAPSAVGTAPPPERAPAARIGGPRALTYSALAFGGAGVVVGAITGALAFSKASEVTGACQGTICPSGTGDTLSTGRTMGRVSTVAFVFGGAGVAAGVVGLVLTRWRPAPRATGWVRPWIGQSGAGIEGTY